jgi:hypothetical protein
MQRTCSLLQAVAPDPCDLRQEISREDLVLTPFLPSNPFLYISYQFFFNIRQQWSYINPIYDFSGPRYELNVNSILTAGVHALAVNEKKVETEVSTGVKIY